MSLLAHGVGSRGDLPLPLWMFTWAAAITLVVSFVGLGVLWTRPVLSEAARGRTLVQGSTQRSGRTLLPAGILAVQWVGRAAALALFALSLWAGLVGTNDTSDNLLPVTLYVVVWVGAQLLGGLVGDVWGAISPLTTLAIGVERAVQVAGRTPVDPPPWLGQWPAAAGLFVFLFYELAHPDGSLPRTLAWMLVVHTVVTMVLAARWGAEWVARHEPFSALFAMIGAMAPLHAERGRLAVRAPMTGLARMPVGPGTLAVLLVVLGGTTYDGFSESEAGRDILGRPTGWDGALTETIALGASILFIAALYGIGVWWTSRVTATGAAEAARWFAPSLVPIVFGYAIAHYAQLLVDETQSFVFRLSDPAGRGWDVFGGADGQIDFNVISVDLIAWVQVLGILFGHVGAIVVAHDRAIERFPAGESLRSQFAMLLVMVAYSTLGLWLLLNA